MFRSLSLPAILVGAAFILASCGGQPPAPASDTPSEKPATETPPVAGEADAEPTVFDVLAAREDLTTLRTLIKLAGLQDDLAAEEGTFTLFAPTNTAFAALPENTVGLLRLPENRGQLAELLQYHALPEVVATADMAAGPMEKMSLANVPVQLDGTGSVVLVGEAVLVRGDLTAANGVVHVIDTVLLPPPLPAVTAPAPTEE